MLQQVSSNNEESLILVHGNRPGAPKLFTKPIAGLEFFDVLMLDPFSDMAKEPLAVLGFLA